MSNEIYNEVFSIQSFRQCEMVVVHMVKERKNNNVKEYKTLADSLYTLVKLLGYCLPKNNEYDQEYIDNCEKLSKILKIEIDMIERASNVTLKNADYRSHRDHVVSFEKMLLSIKLLIEYTTNAKKSITLRNTISRQNK